MTTRRALLFCLGAGVLAPRVALAQRTGQAWRVGFLSPRRRPASLDADYYGAFPRRMHELGYVEGRNLVIEWRFAEGQYERLPGLAADLVRRDVDVILALGPPGASAAQRASATIPIVIVVSVDPVAAGLVTSLAKPGGNITGLSNLAGDLGAKHLEMLQAFVPALSRVALLLNDANPAHAAMRDNVEAAARKGGVAVVTVAARSPAAIVAAFAAIVRAQAGGVLIALDPLFIQSVPEIAALAAQHRLPSVFANREYAEVGGLMSYGQNQVQIYRRAAEYVDRILRGARPGDLPIEQPTELELVINARAARNLGLAIPSSLLARADHVIE